MMIILIDFGCWYVPVGIFVLCSFVSSNHTLWIPDAGDVRSCALKMLFWFEQLSALTWYDIDHNIPQLSMWQAKSSVVYVDICGNQSQLGGFKHVIHPFWGVFSYNLTARSSGTSACCASPAGSYWFQRALGSPASAAPRSGKLWALKKVEKMTFCIWKNVLDENWWYDALWSPFAECPPGNAWGWRCA